MRLVISTLLLLTLTSCSMDRVLVRASIPMIEGGVHALNQENDLDMAEASIPANIQMLEGMIQIDPENTDLRTYAAQAYYGFAYGFNEDVNPYRAAKFYVRGLNHGITALEQIGIRNARDSTVEDFEKALQTTDEDDVPGMFWTASNWAKWVDMNRDTPEGIIALPRVTALMQRVMELDETYYHAGAHLYFGVYYGARSPMMGGNFKKAEYHFNRAREINDNNLLIVDMLQAQYLERQRFDQSKFSELLTRVIEAPDDLDPDLALMNQIAKRKAQNLMGRQNQWF